MRDDLDDLFDVEEAKRRRQERAEMAERSCRHNEAEAAFQEKAKAQVRARTEQATRELLIREYQALGIEPLQITPDGTPTCSVQMMFALNWTIETVDGERKWIKPIGATIKPRVREQS